MQLTQENEIPEFPRGILRKFLSSDVVRTGHAGNKINIVFIKILKFSK